VVRKKPAISHQPPSFSGGKMRSPCSGNGGSSASQNSRRTNWIGFQLTEASMLRPMISIAANPQARDARPNQPR
jgi:hypothetical protein